MAEVVTKTSNWRNTAATEWPVLLASD